MWFKIQYLANPPLWTSGWGFTLSIKLKMRLLYSISLAAILLNFLVDVLCKAPFLEKVFFSIFLIRYISRERNVKGGGNRESASKNCKAQWFFVSHIWMLDDAINIWQDKTRLQRNTAIPEWWDRAVHISTYCWGLPGSCCKWWWASLSEFSAAPRRQRTDIRPTLGQLIWR